LISKGSAFTRTKLKNIETGSVLEVTYKSGDVVPEPDLELREMQFMYTDGTTYSFMDNATFDQVSLSKDEMGDNRYFIVENSVVKVTYFQSRPIGIEVENFVHLAVAETQPNIKGDTSGGGGKPAVLTTGLTVTVPFHINVGDMLKIDTRTSKYVEKVK